MKLFEINPYVRYARPFETRIPKNANIALDHRIFYCLSDSGKIEINNKIYDLKKGSVIFWRAGMVYKNISRDTELTAIGFNFDFFYSDKYPQAPVSYVSENEFKKEMLIEKNLPDNLEFIPDCLFIPFFPYKDKFEEIVEEYSKKEIYYKERCAAILKDILAYMLRTDELKEIYKTKNKSDDILLYIRENYAKKLTNISLGKHFSYHPNYISSLIKKRTGMPLHNYLTSYRIHTAINLLLSGQYTITEIASFTGFNDIKHFSKTFSKVTGNTPSSYINKDFEGF